MLLLAQEYLGVLAHKKSTIRSKILSVFLCLKNVNRLKSIFSQRQSLRMLFMINVTRNVSYSSSYLSKMHIQAVLWSMAWSTALGCPTLVSENETQKTVFEIDHECQVNKNVVEPSLECIRDCADVKYVCNCNVYRYRTNIKFKPCPLIHVHIPHSCTSSI